ncbi:MAG: HemK2/MTQ2 family protein methyltransferase [Candidatus Woesearchaeota archaeon]
MVYEVREDSELLAQEVRKHARGRVLDIGCGSGIQAVTAKNNPQVTSIEAVDIDEEAILATTQQNIHAYTSDKFSNVTEMYETIISNTPYLPNDPQAPDRALDGGSKGYEWTQDFLRQAKKHLAPNGQILFLISTLTNQHVIEQTLQELAYKYTILARKALFMEELLVYQATHALPEHPEATFIAKGKRSAVYRVHNKAIKQAEPRRAQQEAHMLQKVNKLGIGPKYHKQTTNAVYMEFIEGVRIDEYLKTRSKKEIRAALTETLRQCKLLDEANINKKEMTNPYKHVLITNKQEVILIDWERATISKRAQNTNQFREYLKRRGYDELLS